VEEKEQVIEEEKSVRGEENTRSKSKSIYTYDIHPHLNICCRLFQNFQKEQNTFKQG